MNQTTHSQRGAGEVAVTAGTAEGEIRWLLETATRDRPQSGRDLEWTYRRFGVGQEQPESSEEIAATLGFPRNAVDHAERRMIDQSVMTLRGWRLPVLAEMHRQMLAAIGVPWAAMEKDLGPKLGGVTLAEAIRFYEAVKPPARPVGTTMVRVFGGSNALRVLGHSAAEGRLTAEISILSRRLVTYAGAALVHDVRAMAEESYGRTVPLRNVERTLDVLPELEWLDDARRWFWYHTAEMSPMLRRAAEILVLARAPVDLETLYAGLVRAGRHGMNATTKVAEGADPVPPHHVVQAILLRHPDFRRGVANSFTFTGALDSPVFAEPGSEAETAQARIVRALDSVGGAASKAELITLTHDADNPLPDSSLSLHLSHGHCIERLGQAAYAIRGRPIDPARKSALVAHVTAEPQWSVVVSLKDWVRERRDLNFPVSAVPRDVDGVYRMADGHEVRLALYDKRRRYRMSQLATDIRALMSDPSVHALRFFFDSERKTIDVHPERDGAA